MLVSVAQSVGESSHNQEVVGSVPGQGTYRAGEPKKPLSPARWVLWWERVCVSAPAGVRGRAGLQWILFEDSACLPISWWVIYEHTCPHCAECSASFDQKQHDPVLCSPYSPDLIRSDFVLFPWMKMSSKGNIFADVEDVKQKTAEALKDTQIDEFRNCSEQWKHPPAFPHLFHFFFFFMVPLRV